MAIALLWSSIYTRDVKEKEHVTTCLFSVDLGIKKRNPEWNGKWNRTWTVYMVNTRPEKI